jgi:hypothetical protein
VKKRKVDLSKLGAEERKVYFENLKNLFQVTAENAQKTKENDPRSDDINKLDAQGRVN